VDLTLIIAGGLLELGALALAVELWCGRGRPFGKLLWTLILLVPFFGVIAYALLHNPPSPSDPVDRPPERTEFWGGDRQ
jgi:hypothetical protein